MDEKNRKQHQINSNMQEISLCRVNIPVKNQVLYSILQRLQQQCSRELQKNQKLIFSYLWNKEKSVQTNFVSDFSFEQKEGTDKQRQESGKNQQFFQQKNGIIQEEVAQEYLKQDLSPSSFQPKGQKKRYRASESKNVPKNYSKAIFSFMRKNMNITRKVLKKYHIRERDFKKSIERYRGKINTIMELRSIWIQQINPYAKAYRVLSALYMRKYSLPKIFNSRIEYHMRNLKYRYRVFEGIQNPQSLTHMKDY